MRACVAAYTLVFGMALFADMSRARSRPPIVPIAPQPPPSCPAARQDETVDVDVDSLFVECDAFCETYGAAQLTTTFAQRLGLRGTFQLGLREHILRFRQGYYRLQDNDSQHKPRRFRSPWKEVKHALLGAAEFYGVDTIDSVGWRLKDYLRHINNSRCIEFLLFCPSVLPITPTPTSPLLLLASDKAAVTPVGSEAWYSVSSSDGSYPSEAHFWRSGEAISWRMRDSQKPRKMLYLSGIDMAEIEDHLLDPASGARRLQPVSMMPDATRVVIDLGSEDRFLAVLRDDAMVSNSRRWKELVRQGVVWSCKWPAAWAGRSYASVVSHAPIPETQRSLLMEPTAFTYVPDLPVKALKLLEAYRLATSSRD